MSSKESVAESLDQTEESMQRHALPYVIKFVKGFAILSGAYLLGRYELSLAWVLVGLPLWVWRQKKQAEQKHRLAIARRMALSERETITACIEDLPSWVYFPDVERAEWLNQTIAQMWPYIDKFVKDLLVNTIQPNIKQTLPSSMSSFRFEKIDLGDIAPRIGGVKCYTKHVHRDEVILDLELFYAGDCNIKIAINRFKAGIKDLQIHGTVRCVMKPLIPVAPFLGGVTVFFLNRPAIDFNMTNLADVLDFPGLSDLLRNIISDQIASFMVLPNRIPVNLVENIDLAALRFPQPDGVLRICIASCRDLIKADMKVMGGTSKSDPYATATVGAQSFKTKVINNTVTPTWNKYCEAVVDVYDAQTLDLEVYDEDPGSKDDFLGRVSLDIRQFAYKGSDNIWCLLEDVKHGEINVKLQWLTLTQDVQYVKQHMADISSLGSQDQLTTSLLLVHLDSAKHLPSAKRTSAEPDPYCQLTCGGHVRESNIRWATNDPVWEESYNFLISNPDIEEFKLKVLDKKSEKCLGQLEVAVSDLMSAPGLEIKQPHQLADSGPDSNITLTLRLRILKPGVVEREQVDLIKPSSPSTPAGPTAADSTTPAKPAATPTADNRPIAAPDTSHAAAEESTNHAAAVNVSGEPPVAVMESAPADLMSRALPPEGLRQRAVHSAAAGNDSSVAGAGDETGSHGLGRIYVGARYNPDRRCLAVTVHKACGLKGLDKDNLSDPYVRAYLLPGRDKASKRKTQVISDTLRPTWNETIEYAGKQDDFGDKYVELTVKNQVGKFQSFRDSLTDQGMVLITLRDVDLTKGVTQWYDLEPVRDADEIDEEIADKKK